MSVVYETDDFTSPEVYSDPYAYFGWLRETDPVHWNPLYKSWIVTRYDDVVWLVRHHELFSSAAPPIDQRTAYPAMSEEDWAVVALISPDNIIGQDRPQHLAMRQAVHHWFTPAAVERWRAELRATVRELIAAHASDGGMEVKEEFATPLPLRTICLMLGVPTTDAVHLKDLASTLASSQAVVGVWDPARLRDALRAYEELTDYFSPLIDTRTREPGEDLISLVAEATQRGVFTEKQCLDNVILLLLAGHETTLNLITNGTLALVRNPDQWDLLRRNPERMSATAAEECLRYEPSVPALVRTSTAEVELQGETIPTGSRLHWVTSSANRDPRAFEDPNRFDITRSPNRHVAFGGGIHHCLGAALARVEAQEAFRGLAEHVTRLELEQDEVEYLPSVEFRSLRSLEVSFA